MKISSVERKMIGVKYQKWGTIKISTRNTSSVTISKFMLITEITRRIGILETRMNRKMPTMTKKISTVRKKILRQAITYIRTIRNGLNGTRVKILT